MKPFSVIFLIVNSFLILFLPRNRVPIPFLLGACYLTLGQVIMVGPLHFTPLRILIAVGLIRILFSGEYSKVSIVLLDKIIIIWALWFLFVSFFYSDTFETFKGNAGRVYDTLGIYFLFRSFIHSLEDVESLMKIIAVILVPVAVEMLLEQITGHNLFSVLGGVHESPEIRHGRLRAQGPFLHAILAGTVGAVCFPLMMGMLEKYKCTAEVGIFACLVMVITSASSGPLASLFLSVVALFLWRWRHLTKQIKIAAIIGYIVLNIVMKAPAYYIIARIDLVGGSTGWHRARLIETAIEHLNEWWLIGTDYTRHWMPTGVSWSAKHTDITNHYIKMGVLGGLPLMFLFIWTVWCSFNYVGEILKTTKSNRDAYFLWCIGSSLFAHAATMISVSYFDQSFIFLYLNFAIVASLYAHRAPEIMKRHSV